MSVPSTSSTAPRAGRVCVAPRGRRSWVADAVGAGGGTVVDADAAEAVVWTAPDDAAGLEALLATHPQLRWVQLPFAGIEPYVAALDEERTWTCGKGVYATPVAELALSLLLAGMRHVDRYARERTWSAPAGRNLVGARLAVLGGGGIASELLRLLVPFEVEATVVRRHPGPTPIVGARAEVALDQLPAVLGEVDAVVLALALTPETRGVIDAAALERMPAHAGLVNVARGAHVVTDDLAAALAAGAMASAGLDVTDPEPLPDDHPLWSEPGCLITPHVGNTPDMAVPLLSARVRDNVARWMVGRELLGPIDVTLGY